MAKIAPYALDAKSIAWSSAHAISHLIQAINDLKFISAPKRWLLVRQSPELLQDAMRRNFQAFNCQAIGDSINYSELVAWIRY